MYKVREDFIVTPAQAAWENARRWLGGLGLLAILALLVFFIWPRDTIVYGVDVYKVRHVKFPPSWPPILLPPPGTMTTKSPIIDPTEPIDGDIFVSFIGLSPMGINGTQEYWRTLATKNGFTLIQKAKNKFSTGITFERINGEARERFLVLITPLRIQSLNDLYVRIHYTSCMIMYNSRPKDKPSMLAP